MFHNHTNSYDIISMNNFGGNMKIKSLEELKLRGKRVLMRVDFNVPMEEGKITDDNRIKAALKSIKYVIDSNGKLILLSHLGRVKSENDKKKYSLEPVAKRLGELLNKKVIFVPFTRGKFLEQQILEMKNSDVLLIENTRHEDFPEKKESNNDKDLGEYWSSLGDLFVNDAFGTAHRAHASNVGLATNSKESAAGFLMEKEIRLLNQVIQNPVRPLVAVLGGAKVSDKIGVIKNLISIADSIIITGAMAYTFYLAKGYSVGTSLVEKDKTDLAIELMNLAKNKIVLGEDVVTAKEFSNESEKNIRDVNCIPNDEMGMDVGPKTLDIYFKTLSNAKTVIWNGPLGVFEFSRFQNGTKKMAEMLASNRSKINTVVGGGDSAAAVIKFGLESSFYHISTGGGASMELLEGKKLPGIECLDKKNGF